MLDFGPTAFQRSGTTSPVLCSVTATSLSSRARGSQQNNPRKTDAGHHGGPADVERGYPLNQLAQFLGLFHRRPPFPDRVRWLLISRRAIASISRWVVTSVSTSCGSLITAGRQVGFRPVPGDHRLRRRGTTHLGYSLASLTAACLTDAARRMSPGCWRLRPSWPPPLREPGPQSRRERGQGDSGSVGCGSGPRRPGGSNRPPAGRYDAA